VKNPEKPEAPARVGMGFAVEGASATSGHADPAEPLSAGGLDAAGGGFSLAMIAKPGVRPGGHATQWRGVASAGRRGLGT
jgi:hypothetical protein